MIVLLWFYTLWTRNVPRLNPPRHTLNTLAWNPETRNESHESVNDLGPGLGDRYHLPGLSAMQTQVKGPGSSPPSCMFALISSSVQSVTPTITTPSTYLREHRIFQSLSQTRCFGSGVGTRLGSQLNFIGPVEQSSKKLQKMLTLHSLGKMWEATNSVSTSLWLAIFLFVFHQSRLSACRFLYVYIFVVFITFWWDGSTVELATGNSLEMG